MPTHQRKEDSFDRKLINLLKLPIEDKREHLVSEQEDILISLNLKDDYIISLIRKDMEMKSLRWKPGSIDPERTLSKRTKPYKFWWNQNLKFFLTLFFFEMSSQNSGMKK